jgi:hypothetical protein
MICIVKGTVIKILKNGFLVETGYGQKTINTISKASKLGLKPGDYVSVLGGPGKNGFAVSSIYKELPNGESVTVRDESLVGKFVRLVLG